MQPWPCLAKSLLSTAMTWPITVFANCSLKAWLCPSGARISPTQSPALLAKVASSPAVFATFPEA